MISVDENTLPFVTRAAKTHLQTDQFVVRSVGDQIEILIPNDNPVGIGDLVDDATLQTIVAQAVILRDAASQSHVQKYRFLFELHAPVERLMLIAARKEANELTSAETQTISTPDELALVTILEAYERFDVLDSIDLTDSETQAFFDAAKELDVYGTDSALADLRIAAIQANEDAPT